MRQRNNNVSYYSIASYQKFDPSGRKISLTNQIIVQLGIKPMTATELCQAINCLRSSVCCPLVILEKRGIIIKIGSKYDDNTGRTVAIYGLKEKAQIVEHPAPDMLPDNPILAIKSKLFDNEPFQ